MNVQDAALVTAARDARVRAYAPYSNFAVGSALRCADGTIVVAANVENASYGLSMCAERAAVFAALARGQRHFESIAIVGPDGRATPPCGACRQVLAEFAPALRVFFEGPGGTSETTLALLLPQTFAL